MLVIVLQLYIILRLLHVLFQNSSVLMKILLTYFITSEFLKDTFSFILDLGYTTEIST